MRKKIRRDLPIPGLHEDVCFLCHQRVSWDEAARLRDICIAWDETSVQVIRSAVVFWLALHARVLQETTEESGEKVNI
jgi:hypothetical protein